MKILVLTSRLPYPIEKGDKLRIYHQIRELSQGHKLYLCSLVEESPKAEYLDHLGKFCEEIHTFPLKKAGILLSLAGAYLGGKSLQVAYFFRKSIHQKIKEKVREIGPDLIFCQLIRMSEYVRDLEVPAALDYMDCFSEGMSRQAREGKKWQRPIYQREARLLKRYQEEVYSLFDFHSIISEQDRDLLDPTGRLDIHIMPNGIDHDYFHPKVGEEEYELVFVGNMGYFPNVNAVKYLAKKVMPLVWKSLPGAKFLIAGARPHADVQKLGAEDRIVVSGWVPDIREAYVQGKLFVAPIFAGSGQQNKILEAMSMQRPCLTTPLVNNAIHAKAGEEIEVADNQDEFAEKIIDLLKDSQRRKALGLRGRNFVLEQYSWKQSVQKLENWISEGFPTSK